MISDKLKSVIVKELGLGDWDLRDETVATEVPGWDSLSHARVLTAVEDAFGIRFRGMEVIRLKNVGELQKLVDKKIAAK
jgi:acyl carrier protein